MKTNNNIFVGERGYKTNFFNIFKSPRVEQKFCEETFIRNRFPIQGFFLSTFVFIISYFLSSDCYIIQNYCRHEYLLVFSMLCSIFAFIGLHFKLPPASIRILTVFMSLYPHIVIIESFSFDIALVLITLFTNLSSFLLCSVGYLEILYNTASYVTLFLYLLMTSGLYLIRRPLLQTVITLVLYNLGLLFILAFVEKGRKERWVLVDTFKKSERIFRSIYEKLPYAFFVVDKNKRVHYTNLQGLDLLLHFFPYCKSCNLQRVNVNLQTIIHKDFIPLFEDALAKTNNDQTASCFISLKVPKEVRDSESIYDLHGDNQYKVLINPIIWKNNYAYLIAIKDYSSKIKSEQIATKAFSYLLKHIERVTDYYDDQASEKQAKFKLRMLSKLTKFRLSILSTILMFNRMFNKNQPLSEEKNFNIRQGVLAIMGVMSLQSREKGCDLQVTFESSFPEMVCGDEYLFQQIFSNLLKMLLDKVRNTKVSIQCGLQEVIDNSSFLLSFEFELPKSEELSYESVTLKAEAARQATLDHLLDEDEVSFYLALIRPALELFEGKLSTDEIGNKVLIKIEIPFQNMDNTKARSLTKYNTLKSCNFNAGQSRANTYLWSHEEPENEREAAEPVMQGPVSLPNSNHETKVNAEESKATPKVSKTATNTPGSLNHKENKKIREELQKLTIEGTTRNFGSNENIRSQFSKSLTRTRSETTVPRKIEEVKLIRSKHNSIVMAEEPEEDERTPLERPKEVEKGKSLVKKLTIPPQEAPKKEMLMLDHDVPSIENLERLSESVKFHDRQLKLAVTKTILGILDNFDYQYKGENGPEPSEGGVTRTIPILREVGEQIKASGLNETEMNKRVLGHLADNLANQKYRENFMKFMRQYRKQVEDEIYSLQSSTESDNAVSLSDFPPETEPYHFNTPDSPDVLRRALSLNEGKKLWNNTRVLKHEMFSPPDSEKSKGRSLNERILLTPSVSKTIRLQSGRNIRQRPESQQFAAYFSGVLGKGKASKNIEEFKQNLHVEDDMNKNHKTSPDRRSTASSERVRDIENEQLEDLKRKLIPFGSSMNLPEAMVIRTITNKRQWTGKPNDDMLMTAKKDFTYNKVFTILAVDDSDFVFRALEVLPTKYERKLEHAKNGTEALKKYLNNVNQGVLYHLILMDLQMPVMDGFETARNIRAEENDKNYPRTYICAMSAFEDENTINKTRREGMDNFVQKALRVEVLNNLMRTRMEQIGMKIPEDPNPK